MKPSTRKALLILILGAALMALSIPFFQSAENVSGYPLSFAQHIPEWTASTLIFVGFVTFAIASAFLCFTLPPTHALTFGLVLLASSIVFFRLASPSFNPHRWTMLLALLPIIGCFSALLALLAGSVRWIKHRRIAKSD